MSITLATPLLGPVDCGVSQIVAAVKWSPAATAYDETTVAKIAASIVEWSRVYGYRTSPLASQILHETGRFRYGGQVRPGQWNFAGLGATNDGPAGASFSSISEGVLAVCCHRALYQFGDIPDWPQHLQRHGPKAIRRDAVKGAGYLGVCDTIGDFTNGRWAWSPQYPKGTLQNGYAEAIVRIANEIVSYANTDTPRKEPPVSGLPLRVSHIPAGNGNRPGHAMTPEYITVHETSNFNIGADAEMHRQFTHNGGGASEVSFHFVVDDSEIVELLPTTENSWHAGDGGNGTGNRKSIAIEMCVNADGSFVKTRVLTARLVARLMETRKIPIERVVQHNHWSGKNCPLITRRDNLWPSFIQAVRDVGAPREPQADTPDKPHPDARYFPETGHFVMMGFKDHWNQFGSDEVSIGVFGYPLSDELRDGELTIQYFERAVFEWHPGTGVLLRRLGAEALLETAA